MMTFAGQPPPKGIDTITAIATPAGVGGVGIVRISGPEAARIGRNLFSKTQNRATTEAGRGASFPSHQMVHGYIHDPQSGQLIDEVYMATMLAPHSYTREDVVEIQSHGGPLIVSKVLELVLRCGARLAEPGEFTRRAFLNGRIDLSQAEAVADLIAAKSAGALTIAAHQLKGGLKDKISAMRDTVVRIIAEVEAAIEFPDEIEPEALFKRTALDEQLVREVILPVEQLLETFQGGRILKEGVRLVIAGRPNVGKSSLLNRLIGKDKAIVTPIPGTTRDTVEDMLFIDDIAMHIADTAGLRESDDPIEIIGMRKTRESLAAADFILLVIEAQSPIQHQNFQILEQMDRSKTILIVNKIDLNDGKAPLVFPEEMDDIERVMVSAKRGDGLDQLKALLVRRCFKSTPFQIADNIVASTRHKEALEGALACLNAARAKLEEGGGEELVSLDLNQGLSFLGHITGDRLGGEVLDEIFNKFCVGK